MQIVCNICSVSMWFLLAMLMATDKHQNPFYIPKHMRGGIALVIVGGWIWVVYKICAI